ncbi:hypothetical protein AZE42_08783 [Rhizopogon vesiculosus]|uniref:Uncharacterized protein n=1 Tax=Rhizopogon vesiculosus TaxID=180088 RepID=A0A1J8PYJ1_9AGAM|nr:hypothetical protein AZE42_08783 [Rhizopogon vesiculosus]
MLLGGTAAVDTEED